MNSAMEIKIKILPNANGLSLPKYATEQSAGMDLMAAIEKSIVLYPLKTAVIHTGVCIELPKGYEMQIRPRSGLAFKHGITILNSPGTIDSDYRGEIKVLLINLGGETYEVHKGDRIAQGVVSKYEQVKLVSMQTLGDTDRGVGGFGSTGL
jgi:dUTP pyrophosphatase